MGWTVVLDVGKTLAKATLWDEGGLLIERRARPNAGHQADPWELDAPGIEAWLEGVLREFAVRGPVDAVVPVAHGAAAALLREHRLACAPVDYEWPGAAIGRAAYDAQRDPFSMTGSPALPAGLNLGVQLHHLERLVPGGFSAVQILPWAQYWGWTLGGVAASEVTSLGCHTDLWYPQERVPSQLAARRGWAERLAPRMPAGATLGTVRPSWAARTGLAEGTEILCGMHDSNAALLGVRSHPQLTGRDVTVLSTGTWFVAMRSPRARGPAISPSLPETRDCLINVDASGAAVPSARFMGGRELEIILGRDEQEISAAMPPDVQVKAALRVIDSREMILPTAVPGVGPFPQRRHRVLGDLGDASERLARAHVYAALMADASLDLIGSRDCLVVEGRFAHAPVFLRTLASLRPDSQILINAAGNGVALGALSLLNRQPAPANLPAIAPLPVDMSAFKARWRELASRPTNP